MEAGVPMGWEKYTGPFGAVVGIENRFGASAPLKVVMEKFGFTVEGTAIHYAFRDGQFVDVYLMARLREPKS